ncbi:hypothetical protein CCMSSC00406_0005609 [Pleurotus cornucopiae]|uniref:Uncharacterized protein n=1 Tax=Pleurotus cornucopiae TaxID=5321 RepID=A0ACB7IV28_PLECO|nr:hypothetical protein CCMSSC00406_0005609 [Pleurotus cornucopiae]
MSTIPDIITTVYRHYYTTQYVQLSSLTFLLWDYIVTLPDEVRHKRFLRAYNADTVGTKIELFWVYGQMVLAPGTVFRESIPSDWLANTAYYRVVYGLKTWTVVCINPHLTALYRFANQARMPRANKLLNCSGFVQHPYKPLQFTQHLIPEGQMVISPSPIFRESIPSNRLANIPYYSDLHGHKTWIRTGGPDAESSAVLLTNQAYMSAAPRCRAWVHNMLTISAFTMTTSVQLILAFRVYGLYNRAKWVIGFFAVLLLAAIATQLYIVIKLSPKGTPMALPFLHIIACQPTPGAVSHLYLGPITTICPDIAAFLLVSLRGMSHLRVQKAAGFRGSTLIRLLVRDSILYFFMIMMVYTVIIISYVKFSVIESFITFGYGFSVMSIAASRMLINLRKHRNPYDSRND